MEKTQIGKFKDHFNVDAEYEYDSESKTGIVEYTINNLDMNSEQWSELIQSLVKDDKLFSPNNNFLEINYEAPVTISAVVSGKDPESFKEKLEYIIDHDPEKNTLVISGMKEIRLYCDFGEKIISFDNNVKEYEKTDDNGSKCNCIEYINTINVNGKTFKKQVDINIDGIINPEYSEKHKVKEYYREDKTLRERDTLTIKKDITKKGMSEEKIQRQELFAPDGKLEYSIQVVNQSRGYMIEKIIQTQTQSLGIRMTKDAEKSIYVIFEDKITGENIEGFVQITASDQEKAKEIMQCLENHGIVINYYDTLRELGNIDVPIEYIR